MKSPVAEWLEGSSMLSTLKWLNVILRGLMEVGIVAALGYWGYQTGNSPLTRVLLAVLAPVIIFGFWGFVDFRNAGPLSEGLRLFQELAITTLAAVALYVIGRHTLAC